MQATNYHCPSCGASLVYGKSGKMECAACGSAFTFEELNLRPDEPEAPEYHADGHVFSSAEEEQLRRYHCPTCGAEIVADAGTAAAECIYCGTPTVMEKELTGIYRPDGVIPFKTDRKDAENAFKNHCRGKRLLPDGFASQSRIEKISGVYIPYWLYPCTAAPSATYSAVRVTRHRRGAYEIIDTDHYQLFRSAELSFDDLPVSGSKLMPGDVMESIEPFDAKKTADFAISYLSGYRAQRFETDVTQCRSRAEERIKASIGEKLRGTVIGYTGVTETGRRDNLRFGAAKQVLMPVWMLNSVWQGKTYTFAMNGQTGHFIGDLPTDKSKLLKWLFISFGGFCLLGAAIVAVLFLLGVIR